MSNFISFELRNNLRFSILSLIIMSILVALFSFFYPFIIEQNEQISQVFAQMSPQLGQVIGLDDYPQLTTIDTYFNYFSIYMTIVFSVYTSLLAINLFSLTKTKQIDEYLLTKPLARSKLFIARIVSAFILISIVWLFYVFSVGLIVRFISKASISYTALYATNINMLIIASSCFVVAMLISTFAPKIKMPIAVALPIVFGAYALDLVVSLFDVPKLEIISPFSVFALNKALVEIDQRSILIYMCGFTLIMLICLIKFCKSDIRGG